MTAQPTEFKPFAASLPSPIVVVRSAALRYGAALAITAAITLLRLSLNRYLNDKSVFSFYFASVVLAAWYLGLGPSLLNIISGAAIASYYFALPRGSFEIQDRGHITGLIVFCTVGSYLAYLIHWLRRDIARRQKAEADLLAAQELVQAHQAELAHAGRLSLMGEMSASLAHELNQPLHAARNYAQGSIRRLRKTPGSDPEVLVALERISEASDRAAEILRRVRDYRQQERPHVAPDRRRRRAAGRRDHLQHGTGALAGEDRVRHRRRPSARAGRQGRDRAGHRESGPQRPGVDERPAGGGPRLAAWRPPLRRKVDRALRPRSRRRHRRRRRGQGFRALLQHQSRWHGHGPGHIAARLSSATTAASGSPQTTTAAAPSTSHFP